MNSALTLLPRCSAFFLRHWPWLGWLLLLPLCNCFHGLWRYAFGLLIITSVIALIAFAVGWIFKIRKALVALTLWSLLIGWFYLNCAWTANPNVEIGDVRQAEFSDTPHSYYDLLTESVTKGRLDLGIAPSKELQLLEDPYNPKGRIHGTYLWDASYWKGKYYIYFGITPVLTLFLPFYNATGIFFPGCLAAALFCSLGYLFSLLSLLALCRIQSEFDDIHRKEECRSSWPLRSTAHATLTALVLGMGNFCPFMLKQPFVYQIAVAGGFCFGMMGIFSLLQVWLKRKKGLSCLVWLAISGLSLALAVGSRPSLIICSVLPILLFYFLRHEKILTWGRLLAFGIPYCSYGLFLAAYNYLRFESPFEFGFKYVLDDDSNILPVFSVRNLAVGLFGFLIEPPKLLADYPYVTLHWVWPLRDWWHTRCHEPVIGVFWLFPPIALAFGAKSFNVKYPPFVRSFLAGMLLIFISVLILNATVSLTARYLIDLLPYVLIGGLFIAFQYYNLAGQQKRNVITVILVATAIWCTSVTFFSVRCGPEGDLNEEILHFKRLLKHKPDNDYFNRILAQLLNRQNKFDEAIPYLEKTLEINPNSFDAHSLLGKYYYRQMDFDRAVTHFQAVERIVPELAYNHQDLGSTYLVLNRLDEALDEFRLSLQINPRDHIALVNFGCALFKKNMMEEAMEQFRFAVAVNPAHAPAHVNLALALGHLGRIQESIAEYRETLRLDPGEYEALYPLGKRLYLDGSRAEGMGFLFRAFQIHQNDPTLLNDLAWMLATAPEDSLRDGKRALELALQADKSAGGNEPAILGTLAAACAETGDYPRALETARRALALAKKSGNEGNVAGLMREIALYEAGKPCREP